MKRNGTLKVLSLGLLSALALSGCGLDRTPEEYRAAKRDQELGKMKAVEGSYIGSMTSKATNEILGEFAVQLVGTTEPGTSPDGLGSEDRPVLRGTMGFSGSTSTVIPFKSTHYDVRTRIFKAKVQVPTSSVAVSGELLLQGKFENGFFIGTIESPAFPNEGAKIELRRTDLPPGESLVAPKKPGEGNNRPNVKKYSGVAEYQDKHQRRLNLDVAFHTLTGDEEFLFLVTKTQIVDVTLVQGLEYGPNANPFFKGAVIDLRTATLRARATRVVSGIQSELQLDCRVLGNGESAKFECDYSSTASGYLFHAIFEPVQQEERL